MGWNGLLEHRGEDEAESVAEPTSRFQRVEGSSRGMQSW